MLHTIYGVRVEASYGMGGLVSYPGTAKIFSVFQMV